MELIQLVDKQTVHTIEDFKNEKLRIKKNLSTTYVSQQRIMAQRGIQNLFARIVVSVAANLNPPIKLSEADVTGPQPTKVLKLIESLLRIHGKSHKLKVDTHLHTLALSEEMRLIFEKKGSSVSCESEPPSRAKILRQLDQTRQKPQPRRGKTPWKT